MRTARRERSLRNEDPPLNGVTDPHRHQSEAGCTSNYGFALFDCGEVESGGTTQRSKGSGDRERQEPSVEFSCQQSLQRGVQSRCLQWIEAQHIIRINHVMSNVATDDGPLGLLN